jgi:hypothetical protein
MSRRIRSLGVWVLVALVMTVAVQAQQVAIPDTPAGHVLSAFMDAFNSGDRARMQTYHDTYDAKTMSVDVMVGFRSQTGGFDLLAINKSEPSRIEYFVKERASTTRALGVLEVIGADSPKVASSSLRLLPPSSADPPDFDIDAATRDRVINGAIAKLNENYVYADLAKKLAEALRRHQKAGDYNAITNGDEFAALLTRHLREVAHDKHMRVNFSPVKLTDFAAAPGPQQMEDNRKRYERDNCLFTKVEILPGNIGYMKVNGFGPPDVCAPTAIAAMNFVANVDAIIFDLRDNNGGDPAMVSFLASYLFERPTHLNDLYTRKTNETRQFWTDAHVQGKWLGSAPAFVLTSSRTFSGGEEFAYDLQTQKRATIVGETTGGGAHPVRAEKIDDRFLIAVPFARAINPITKTNWEGTGVTPDVGVPEADALTTAQKLAAETHAAPPGTPPPAGR